MSKEIEYEREGIRRLLDAASNPNLTAGQAEALMDEARANCDIVFGAKSDEEFSQLVKENIRAIIDDLMIAVDR